MLNRAHMSMGAASGALAVNLVGGSVSMIPVAVCVASIGAALPDMDTHSKQVGAVGDLGTGISTLVKSASAAFYEATSTTYDKPPLPFGYHRTLTHTLFFAGLMFLAGLGLGGSLISLAIACGVGLMFLITSGVIPRYARTIKAPISAILFATFGAACFWFYLKSVPSISTVLIGVFLLAGVLSHLLGDIITEGGVPLFAPFIKVSGRRWFTISILPIKASSKIANNICIWISLISFCLFLYRIVT